jgi:hypothetical protein
MVRLGLPGWSLPGIQTLSMPDVPKPLTLLTVARPQASPLWRNKSIITTGNGFKNQPTCFLAGQATRGLLLMESSGLDFGSSLGACGFR